MLNAFSLSVLSVTEKNIRSARMSEKFNGKNKKKMIHTQHTLWTVFSGILFNVVIVVAIIFDVFFILLNYKQL